MADEPAVTPEVTLDVSGLAPPEPMERVLEAIETLEAGRYVRMLIDREPFPLYGILHNHGFKYSTRSGQETLYAVYIWHKGDDAAETAVKSAQESRGDSLA